MAEPLSISALGAPDLVPTVNRDWDPLQSSLGTEEYFVLTRVDGKTSLRGIYLTSGFSEDKVAGILHRLRSEGAILFPGDTPPPRKAQAEGGVAGAEFVKHPTPAIGVPAIPPPAATPSFDQAALAEPCDLTLEQKRAILVKHAGLTVGTLFDLLEVGWEADKRALKRSYFRISKVFHPDRFYGKSLGSFHDKLAEIFKACTLAFDQLSDDEKRAEYKADLELVARGGWRAESPSPPRPAASAPDAPAAAPKPTRAERERAAGLFEQACQHQVTGELPKALTEFAEAIRLDPTFRYCRRAAEACLQAQELRSAEEYATKAAELDPQNASAHRTLAKVFRASSRMDDARRALETALQLDPHNQHVAAELEELANLQLTSQGLNGD